MGEFSRLVAFGDSTVLTARGGSGGGAAIVRRGYKKPLLIAFFDPVTLLSLPSPPPPSARRAIVIFLSFCVLFTPPRARALAACTARASSPTTFSFRFGFPPLLRVRPAPRHLLAASTRVLNAPKRFALQLITCAETKSKRRNAYSVADTASGLPKNNKNKKKSTEWRQNHY